MDKKEYLISEIKKLDIELSDLQVGQFMDYYALLCEKNKVMNLTAITDFEDVVVKHFADSLAVVNVREFKRMCGLIENAADVASTEIAQNDDFGAYKERTGQSINMLDLGSGAGFPGIPLKIVFPQLKTVHADSLNKRVVFLNDTIEKLGLKDIYAIHGRAEELARKPEYREKFDLCVSRAVANMSVLSEYCLPFVKPGGYFVCYKAGGAAEEISSAAHAVNILGGKLAGTTEIVLPGTDIERIFAVVKKIYTTPKAYPRKAGTPAKKPL